MLRHVHIPHCALLAVLLQVPRASAQEDFPVSIDVDASAGGEPLRPIWAYFGYDEVNATTHPEGRELLRTLSDSMASQVRVRTHFLFNSGDGTLGLKWGSTNVYTEDASGSPVYDFSIIDEVMDAKIEAGVLPLFEMGFMPEALSVEPDPYENSGPYGLDGGSYYPPNDYDKWADLVATYAEHVKQRYPGSEDTWQWELWNEPDIAYWQGTFEQFTHLYDSTEAALHGVMPDATLAAPAVARPSGEFLVDFLEHCASGTNAVTGETGTRLDMVSFHAKGGTTYIDGAVVMDLGNQLLLHQAGFRAIRDSQFANRPVVISEADPDGCAACPATGALHFGYRYSPAYGAYELATMKRSLDLATEMDIDLRGVLTWAFTFPLAPLFAGNRALSTGGIRLPVLSAFELLGQLEGERLRVESDGALSLGELLGGGASERADVDALAAADGDTIRILVWHYHDYLVDADAARVNLQVALPSSFDEAATVSHARVDGEHGDVYAVWLEQGRPEEPTRAQLAELQQVAENLEYEPPRTVAVQEGTIALSLELPRFGVSLLTLSPAEASATEASGSDAPGGGGCSCRTASQGRRAPHFLLMVSLLFIAAARGRVTRPARAQGRYMSLKSPTVGEPFKRGRQ